jgi:hypothetical protein
MRRSTKEIACGQCDVPAIRIELMTLSLLVIRSTTEPSGRQAVCEPDLCKILIIYQYVLQLYKKGLLEMGDL